MSGDRITERGQHAVVLLASAIRDPKPSGPAEQPPWSDHHCRRGEVGHDSLFDLRTTLAERDPREVGCRLCGFEADRGEARLDPLALGNLLGDLSGDLVPVSKSLGRCCLRQSVDAERLAYRIIRRSELG